MNTPEPNYTPQQGANAYQPPPPPTAKSPRKSGWIWAIAIVVVLALLASMCVVPFIFAAAWSGGSSVYSDGIALIHVDGVIAGTGGDGSLSGGYVTPEYMIDILQAADEDPGIEAILLRVDSPGGTVAASQEIAMEVARLDKPVIVSVGDLAASGAYWIASQADVIVATPSSSIGSIGVILQVPNLEGLMDKIGVDYTVITRGEFKDAGSPFRSLNATELAMLDEDLDFVYEQFIEGVAEGRGLEVEEVREMATGWTWAGVKAQEMGLVDEIGTYSDAVEIAAEEAGISASYEVVPYDEPSPFDVLMWFLSATESLGRIGDAPWNGSVDHPVVR